MENMSESDESFHSTVDPMNGTEQIPDADPDLQDSTNDNEDQDLEPNSLSLTPESVLHFPDSNANNNLDLTLSDDHEVSFFYTESDFEKFDNDKKAESGSGGGRSHQGSRGSNTKYAEYITKTILPETRLVSHPENSAAAVSFLNSFEELGMSYNFSTSLLPQENGATGASQKQNHSKPRYKDAKKSAKSNGLTNGPILGASSVVINEQPVSDIQLIYRRLDLQFGQLKDLTDMIKESNKRIEKLERRNTDLSEDVEDDASTLCDMDNLHVIHPQPTAPTNSKLNVRNEPPTQLSKTVPMSDNNSGQPIKPVPRRNGSNSRNYPNSASATSHASNFIDGISHGSMLNNQIPPGARTNNFVDNFRSNTHQNMLSSPKSNATLESQRHMNDISSQESLDALRNENYFGSNAKSGIWDTSSDSKKWGNCFVQNVGGKKRNKDQQALSFTKFQPANGTSSGPRRSTGSGRSRSPLEVSAPAFPEPPQSFCPPSNSEGYGPFSRTGMQQEVLDNLNKFLVLNEGRNLFLSSLFRKLCELRTEYDREQALSALSFVNWDADHGRARCAHPPDTRSHFGRNMNDIYVRGQSGRSELDFPINNSYPGGSPMTDFKNRNALLMDEFGFNVFGQGQALNPFPTPPRFVAPVLDPVVNDNKSSWNLENPYTNGANVHELNQNRNCRPTVQPIRVDNIVPTTYTVQRPSQILNIHSNGFHDVQGQQNYPFNSTRGRDTVNPLVLQAPPRSYAVNPHSRSNLTMDNTNFNNGRQNFGFSSDAYLNNSRQFRHTKSDSQSSGSCSGLAQSVSEIAMANNNKRKENQSQVRESHSHSDLTNQSNEATGFIDSVPQYNGNEDPEDEWSEFKD